ncbi:alpha/beta fold hydrolase [Kineosporia succinea]|uniref:Pimeloyl-ACP methyl ester carboxylesterase n=1 Tax=Kineosporia succinea TaxID=84632 RepID=A0ABT9P5K0_9ACTN|nr:alpha/beta fold hydrolase [Kineosporia succinea]MDP9827460.1 pimeloyl-ACP methyl ester carboxylesterase [Kineosporia succinea]
MDSVNSPVDGTRIVYRTFPCVSGDEGAPTVLMSHGTALSQAIWRGFGYVRALTTTHRVITVDLRGHGRSDGPHHETAYGMDAFVADIIAVLDEVIGSTATTGRAPGDNRISGPGQAPNAGPTASAQPIAGPGAEGPATVDYVGYSLGGRIGFSLAATHPERLNRFVSIAGAPGTDKGAFDRVFFPGCITALREGGMDGFLTGWQHHTGTQLDAATRHAFAANDAQALAAYMSRSEDDPGVDDDTLERFTVPTQMIVGALDRERVSAAQHVREVLPSAQLLVVDGATHGSILREPATLQAVTAFLAPA